MYLKNKITINGNGLYCVANTEANNKADNMIFFKQENIPNIILKKNDNVKEFTSHFIVNEQSYIINDSIIIVFDSTLLHINESFFNELKLASDFKWGKITPKTYTQFESHYNKFYELLKNEIVELGTCRPQNNGIIEILLTANINSEHIRLHDKSISEYLLKFSRSRLNSIFSKKFLFELDLVTSSDSDSSYVLLIKNLDFKVEDKFDILSLNREYKFSEEYVTNKKVMFNKIITVKEVNGNVC